MVERLKQLINTSTAALGTLKALENEPFSIIVRDAAIQRFEYTSDLIWKTVLVYLESEGIVCQSPKGCYREAFKAGIISEEETILALAMVDDRNLTSHTYREEIATEIFQKIKGYTVLMRDIIDRVRERIESME